MKTFLLTIAAFLIVLCAVTQAQAQQFQPEDVLQTTGQYQLKFKHLIAYINIELEGEDPALLNDQAYMQELGKECVEEFVAAPAEFIQDMEQHYQAMLMGASYEMGNESNQPIAPKQPSPNDNSFDTTPPANGTINFNNSNNQWKQALSGSVLYTTTTQSSGGLFVQSTQIMHLCPNGTAFIYSVSGGGGSYGGMDITDPRNMQFEGSFNWNIGKHTVNRVFFRCF